MSKKSDQLFGEICQGTYYQRHPEEFQADAELIIRRCRIPEQYISGIVSYAWQEGHANGHYEVYNHIVQILDTIFKVDFDC